MAVNAHFRGVTDRIVLPFARALAAMRLTPNAITALGLIGTGAGMALLLLGRPLLGASVVAFAAILDAFDGAVARLTDTASEIGAFYDSVADRVSDAIIFGAALWVARDEPRTFSLLAVAFSAAMITSYIRAKAESLGYNATVGLVERPERIAILLLAVGLGFLEVGAWLLAVGGVITIAQRLHAVVGQAGDPADAR